MADKAKMMAKAYRLRKDIEDEIIEVEEKEIKIKIGGDQRIRHLSINGSEDKDLMDVVNKAIKKAQEKAALKMKEMMSPEDITDE